MVRETAKHFFKGTRKAIRRKSLVKVLQPRSRQAADNDRITMWVGEQKFNLNVEDWMRGH